jgi:hypothetical protein
MKALFLAAAAALGFGVGSAGAGGGNLIRDNKVTEMRRRRPGVFRHASRRPREIGRMEGGASALRAVSVGIESGFPMGAEMRSLG